jgi:hypothetical protein
MTGELGLRVGKVINRHKIAKHFTLAIDDTSVSHTRKQGDIDTEVVLDGIYIVRTSVAADRLDAPGVVESYKGLKVVEAGHERRSGSPTRSPRRAPTPSRRHDARPRPSPSPRPSVARMTNLPRALPASSTSSPP